MAQEYANQHGVRAAIASVEGIPIDSIMVEKGPGGGWIILLPFGINPDPGAVAAWAPPEEEPEPVTDVEVKAQVFETAQMNAMKYLNRVKGQVHVAMVATNAYDDATATAEGVRFVRWHSEAMASFEQCGGHPDAARNLLDAISSDESKAQFPWLLTYGVLVIFVQALTY